ncbi:MAG: hypothetical protein A2428_09540 [Bdellovibrionales bacterium RIFOXYC1_FULL_54_43]|nr:MAG: hypothetical protein A2428_09540 [Bdellovibrionales bacterium RIFOXYC1_FULL_54_43]OFZ84205.1 MAG: hypothetical protein A2603_14610 [Bdellovibrionales bacterium RIFOXYD1_FULL_55_31]
MKKMALVLIVASITCSANPAHAMGKKRVSAVDPLCGAELSLNRQLGNDTLLTVTGSEINDAFAQPQTKSVVVHVAIGGGETWGKRPRNDVLMTGRICDKSKPQQYIATTDSWFNERIRTYVANKYASDNGLDSGAVDCRLSSSNQQVTWSQYRVSTKKERNIGTGFSEYWREADSCYQIQYNFENASLRYRCFRVEPRPLEDVRKDFCATSLRCEMAQSNDLIKSQIRTERAAYCSGNLQAVLVGGDDSGNSDSAISSNAKKVAEAPVSEADAAEDQSRAAAAK